MRILITNDDGIESEGIQVLARTIAAAGHQVVVVAPNQEYSGFGAAIGTIGEPDQQAPLEVRRVAIDGLDTSDGHDAWSLAGPPALTVIAACLGGFGDPPELVVSGINAGLNTGRSVVHSGTVGAALTAQNFGLSALAVSTEWSRRWQWQTAADVAVEVLDRLIEAPRRSVLNLNVPALPRDQVHGVRWARLAPFGAVRAAVQTRTDEHLQFELVPTNVDFTPDTDQGAVAEGWAALTTLTAVVEAWPADLDQADGPDELEFGTRLAPGAPLHAVHQIPDASDHRMLRPRMG